MSTHIRIEGRAGRITLARPKALNALTREMIRDIDAALCAWAGDPAVALLVVDGEGERAFCAGGDITYIYHVARAGDLEAARSFWREEYIVNTRLARFPKPVIALMQGFTMGGGIGLGGHASHRIVGASSRVSMPECAIGLVPDIGASHLLAQSPGRLGEYLGLTGHRMGSADAILAGFADFHISEARWPELVAAAVETGDAGIFAAAAEPPPPAALAEHRDAIDTAFSKDDLPAIRAALPDTAWGRETGEILDRQSALSMAATLRLVRAARAEPGVEKALTREFRFSWRACSEGEHVEGIRAAVIDKDRKPRWRDDILSLEPARVDAMLAPLGPDELELPDLPQRSTAP
jgi:enoyl-CoA hydratase